MPERKGPLTLPSGIEGIAYVNVDDVRPDNESPNVESIFASVTWGSDYLGLFRLSFWNCRKNLRLFYLDGIDITQKPRKNTFAKFESNGIAEIIP